MWWWLSFYLSDFTATIYIYIKNVIERKRKIDEFNINSPYTSDDFKKKNFIKQGISYKTMATSIARSYTYKLPWIYASSPSTSTNKLSNIIYLLSFWYLWNMIICLISSFFSAIVGDVLLLVRSWFKRVTFRIWMDWFNI